MFKNTVPSHLFTAVLAWLAAMAVFYFPYFGSFESQALRSNSQILTWNFVDEVDIKTCEKFTACDFISVFDTYLCANRVVIHVTFEGSATTSSTKKSIVVDSPRSSGAALVEIGIDSEEFDSFTIDEVLCASSQALTTGKIYPTVV